MKKLLLLLIYFPLFFGCGNQQSQVSEDVFTEDTPFEEAQFIISDEFVLADDVILQQFLEENISELDVEKFVKKDGGLELSDESWQYLMIEWKNTSSLYLRKNSDDYSENIVVKHSEVAPTEYWLNFLVEGILKEADNIADHLGISFEMIDSGMEKYDNTHPYIFIRTRLSYDGMSRYGLQCIISVNGRYYQIYINTFNRLSLEDVLLNIK